MGMLCAAGLTTMGEILDHEIPVAIDVETKRETAFYRAAAGAIASAFGGKGAAKKYTQALTNVLREVQNELRASRGLPRDAGANEDAEAVKKAFGGLVPAKRRKGKAKK